MSDIVCVLVLCRMKLMVLSHKFVFAALLMATYMIVWRLTFCDRIIVGTIVAFGTAMIMSYMYKNELTKMLTALKKRMPKR